MSEEPNASGEFKDRLWKTKGCRFAAHDRLQKKHYAHTFTISFLSLLAIVAAVVGITFATRLTDTAVIFLNIGIIALSLFILIVSLLEGGRNYLVTAEYLHRCGVRMVSLINRYEGLERKGEISDADFTRVSEDYEQALRECPANHETVDYAKVMADNSETFGLGLSGRAYNYARFYASVMGLNLAFLAIPLFITVAVLRYVPLESLIEPASTASTSCANQTHTEAKCPARSS